MIRIANLGSFFISLYFWFNYAEWTIIPNSNNIISRTSVNIIQSIPNYLISFFILALIVIFLKNTIFNHRGFLLYLITLLLFHITIHLSLNYLMLEPTTTFFLFKIHHTIPIEYYQQHLNNCVNHIVSMNPALLEGPSSSLLQFEKFIKNKLDYNYLITLNAQQIEDYALELCKNYNEQLHLSPKKVFFWLSTGLTVLAVIEILYYFLTRTA